MMMFWMSTALAGGLEVAFTPTGADEPLTVSFSGVQEGMPQKATWELSPRHRYHLEVEVHDVHDGVAVIEAEVVEERERRFGRDLYMQVTEPTFKVRLGEEATIAVKDGDGEGYELALVLDDDGLMDAGATYSRTATRRRVRRSGDSRDRSPEPGPEVDGL